MTATTQPTLTVEEHRWLLNAYLNFDPYDSTILTKADRQLADGLASKGLAKISELGRTQHLNPTVNGNNWRVCKI